ncbi:MAG: GntR family transcriptional regulator [Alphaproteobacteria bacterium]|nr:GntR family transcriptional regulator [Alphaproteobacteria bacterium]
MDPNAIETAIRDEIEAGRLMPGTALRQEALAARFGVSRQPVRLALGSLLAAGLVERRTDRGLAVAGISAPAAAELAAVRVLVETEALRLALPKLDAVRLRRAHRIAADIVEEDDPAAIEELDVAFHAILYAPGGNARLLRLVEALRREGRRAYAVQPPGSAFRRRLAAEHAAILAACEASDAAAAVRTLTDHLRGPLPAEGEQE